MTYTHRQSRTRWLRVGLFASVVALCIVIFTTVSAFADTVNIYDRANVLNANQVKSEGQNLAYPLGVYTFNSFNGTSSDFDQSARNTVTNSHNPRLIVIGIDTVHKHVYVTGGTGVPLTSSQYSDAANAFKGAGPCSPRTYPQCPEQGGGSGAFGRWR